MQVCTSLYEWLRGNEIVLVWLGAFSVVSFIATLIAIPFIVARIPTDYFIRDQKKPFGDSGHTALNLFWLVLKNILGAILILAGLAMLVLPGQGVLTMLLGIMLMNFPGKRALERYLIRQPTIFKALNWMRARADRPDLIVSVPAAADSTSQPQV